MPPVKQPPEPDDGPAPIPEPGEPQWSRDLKQMISELPGKLRATITDDDRKGIAEHVHGLFEGSGAFRQEEPPPEPGDEPPEPPPGDQPAPTPDAGPGKDSWARRTFGRW